MSEAIVAEGAEKVSQEAVQPQDGQVSQPSSDKAELSVAEQDNSLNDVAAKSEESTSEDSWKKELLQQKKNSDAENKRRREKNEKLESKLKDAEARIEKLESQKPTLEGVGGDYDALQRAEQRHAFKEVLAEDKLNDAQTAAKAIEPDNTFDEVNKASENYAKSVGDYFSKDGAVSVQAYQAKQAVFNDALSMRSPNDQALIINELASMGTDAAEVLMNVADDSKALFDLANAKTPFQAARVLYEAKTPARVSDAPEPVPDIGGSTGAISGNYDTDTIEGLNASLKARGIQIR